MSKETQSLPERIKKVKTKIAGITEGIIVGTLFFVNPDAAMRRIHRLVEDVDTLLREKMVETEEFTDPERIRYQLDMNEKRKDLGMERKQVMRRDLPNTTDFR